MLLPRLSHRTEFYAVVNSRGNYALLRRKHFLFKLFWFLTAGRGHLADVQGVVARGVNSANLDAKLTAKLPPRTSFLQRKRKERHLKTLLPNAIVDWPEDSYCGIVRGCLL